MRRVVRAGGIVAATTWDTFGGMPSFRFFWDIAAAIEPSAIDRRSTVLVRPMTQSGEMREAFLRAGLVDVTEQMLVIRMEFADFADYLGPMMNSKGTHAEFFANLQPQTRARIEDAVRAAYLCGRNDGPRSFASVAWGTRGVVPE
jgi:hypothetical protein